MNVQPERPTPGSVLRFGIWSFDQLLEAGAGNGSGGLKALRTQTDENVSVCIVGTDGTGKSVLALHLASTYHADLWGREDWNEDTWENFPCILYVTTDLSAERAQRVWDNFALNRPFDRRDMEHGGQVVRAWSSPPRQNYRLPLRPLSPLNIANADSSKNPVPQPKNDGVSDNNNNPRRCVSLIDLASETAGDDWGLLNRTLASLNKPTGKQPRHLLIVDAIEGLEVLVGDKDAFGEQRSRRSRTAHLLRTARKKAHVVFIVEDPKHGSRVPEEFISDVVIRMRNVSTGAYSRRTIEVDKCRGQSHVRGQHDFVIRSGRGSTTGNYENPDDPKVPPRRKNSQSYLYVFPSLHFLSRRHMWSDRVQASSDPEHTPVRSRLCAFGVRYLDNMLSKRKDEVSTPPWGLPSDSPAALIGESGTYKSRLGRSFLSSGYLENHKQCAAVLLTTKDMTADILVKRMKIHVPQDCHDAIDLANEEDRIICRRLEVHFLSSATLIHIVQSLIAAAESKISRDKEYWQIRFVIDNWTSIEKAYPEVANDPLFLPFLLFYLRSKGISTLILATESGGPRRIFRSREATELRQLTSHHLYTWHVPFYGSSRVAITALPPMTETQHSYVRELRPARNTEWTSRGTPSDRSDGADTEDMTREELIVSPHFELYSGLEIGEPKIIPLNVHLYTESPNQNGYFAEIHELLQRLMPESSAAEVAVETADSYERIRDFSHLEGLRLGYTMVYQVDEYWAESGPRDQKTQRSTSRLRNQKAYLWATVTDKDGLPEEVEDPFRVFQPSEADRPPSQRKKRIEFFHPIGHNYFVPGQKEHDGNQYAEHWIQSKKCPTCGTSGFCCFDATHGNWRKTMRRRFSRISRNQSSMSLGGIS